MAKKGAPRKANSKKPTTSLNKVKKSKQYPIVAIGASTGGMEAVSELLNLSNKEMTLNQGLMWPLSS